MDRHRKQFVQLRGWLLGREYHRAARALELAASLHTGTRKDGVTPEVAHPLSVALYARTLWRGLLHPEETLAAALLHDVPEDFGIDPAEIERVCGPVAAEAVALLTKEFRGAKKADADYYRGIASSPIASVVKGADRVHNVQTMGGAFAVAKQKSYIAETRELVLPMLKAAREKCPEQYDAYQNVRHMLWSQIDLIEAIHRAAES